jgi:hypothetical protein
MGDEMDEEVRDLESPNWTSMAGDRAAFNNTVGASGMGAFSQSPDRKNRVDYFTIGLDDDMSISTIANDTVSGSILHCPFDESHPLAILGDVTPTKKTKKTDFTTRPEKQISSLDPDEATQPETPQSEHGQKQFNTEGVPKMKKLPSNDTGCSPRMKSTMCIASILGCIMLGAIGVLSYSFYAMRSEPESPASDLDLVPKGDADAPDFDYSPFATFNISDPGEEEEQTPAGTHAPADSITAFSNPPTPPPTLDPAGTQAPADSIAAFSNPPTPPHTLDPAGTQAPADSIAAFSNPPTPSPTLAFSVASTVSPTLSPSSAPSPSLASSSAPTECLHSVMPEKSCYLVGEPLVFDFHVCDGAASDLISLYEDDATFEFKMAAFWTRTCGLPDCRATLGDNVMSFDNRQPYEISFSRWPVARGSYKLRLLRVTSTGALAVINESAVIEISEQCN